MKSMPVFTKYMIREKPRHNFVKFALEARKLGKIAISGPDVVKKRYRSSKTRPNSRKVPYKTPRPCSKHKKGRQIASGNTELHYEGKI